MLSFHKIRKFVALDSHSMRLFIEAYVTLGVIRGAILTIPFNRLVKSLEQHRQYTPPELDETQMDRAHAIGDAVRSAANHTPWESTCLAQVLAAQRMLGKRGIRGVFFLGATMEGTDQKGIQAHAWLQCGDQIITGEAGHEQYAVLSIFSWKGNDLGSVR